jgi:hypothetical protein
MAVPMRLKNRKIDIKPITTSRIAEPNIKPSCSGKIYRSRNRQGFPELVECLIKIKACLRNLEEQALDSLPQLFPLFKAVKTYMGKISRVWPIHVPFSSSEA